MDFVLYKGLHRGDGNQNHRTTIAIQRSDSWTANYPSLVEEKKPKHQLNTINMSEPGRKDFTTSMFETRFYASRLLVSSESSRLHIARYIVFGIFSWRIHMLFSQKLKRKLRPTPPSLHSRRPRKQLQTPLIASLVGPSRMNRNREPRQPSTKHSVPMTISRAAPPLPCEFSLLQDLKMIADVGWP